MKLKDASGPWTSNEIPGNVQWLADVLVAIALLRDCLDEPVHLLCPLRTNLARVEQLLIFGSKDDVNRTVAIPQLLAGTLRGLSAQPTV